ncbi:MAG: glycoside hydrolase family 43 protein [Chitinophagaceae bacterium]|nr:glycoside hydrolase family 43 protein [Chitinophagaceae bacterium]
MKKNILLISLLTIHLSLIAQSYRNPVIPGFHPDPSVCRVGENYYLVNSTFEYFPGIPIWTSKDLIHWKQIGNVLNRASQLPLKNCKPSNGIYAPTIRYHNNIFYMVVTNVAGDRGYKNFYVTATNPAGPWGEPIFYDQNGIDPSLFFDEDGKVYFLSNRATKPTDERAIYQSEIDIKTGKRISDIKQVWKGAGGSYVEGPHMYKKDGYYYLLTAEGGTAYGHTVAIGRSKNVWGPFESCPHNPILTNRMAYNIIQGTGHADLVQAPDSSWWMVHLAFRPAVDGIHFIGRETCVTPVEWKQGEWPVVNKIGQTDEVIKQLPPNYQAQIPLPFTTAVKTNFDEPLSFEWLHLRNPDSSNYSLTERQGWLRLKGSAYSLYDWESPTFIARRQEHFNFSATTLIDFNPAKLNEEAGLTVMMDNRFHYDFYITTNGKQRTLNLRYTLDSLNQLYKQIVLPLGNVALQVTGDKRNYTFSYKINNGIATKVGTLNTRFLGTEVSGGYNGVVIGLYATGNGVKSNAVADFDWFEYKPL